MPSDLHGSAVEYRCAVHGKGGIAVRQFAADHRVHGAGAELGFGHVDADCSVREVCGGCAGEEDRTAAVEDDVFNGLNAVKGAEVTGRCRTESQGVRSAVAGNPAVHFAAGDRESVIAVSAEDIADDLTAGDRELIIARPKADLAADQGIGAVDGDGIGAFGESNIAENNSTVIESQTVCSSGSPINGITACGRGCQVVVSFLPLRRIPHLGKPELQIVLQIPAHVNRAGEIVQSDVGSVDADCGAGRG